MKEKLIMEIPHYEHKYITLFNNEESYWNKESSFEEVNYSAIKTELTDDSKRNYQPSIRTTNKDNEYIMNYWKSDVMRGKFFLEIIWGYFGWEWKDYTKMIDSGTPAICTFQVSDREPAIYLALSANGVITSSEPYELTMEENEDGTFYLTDGTYYVGLAGNNNYDLSSDPTKKAKITIETTEDGQVYLKESKGYIGHNPATDTNKFYADKPKQSMYSFIKTKVGGIDPTYITYTGGNLYKVKEIETVRSIIDGYRLQHINNFLNSQDKITLVEKFDTSNIICANNAFARLIYPEGSNYTPNSSLFSTYLGLTLNITEFPKVVEANKMFRCTKLYIKDNIPLSFPKLVAVNQFYSVGEITDNLSFDIPNIEELTYAFMLAKFTNTNININSLFNNGFSKIRSLKGLMRGAVIYCFNINDSADIKESANATITLDLTSSEISEDSVIDLSYAFSFIKLPRDSYGTPACYGDLTININFNKPINLEGCFEYISRTSDWIVNQQFDDATILRFIGDCFKRLHLDFVTDPNRIPLIKSLDYTFRGNRFIEIIPIEYTFPNATDNSIYSNCIFDADVNYDFSPNQIINESSDQFYGCTFNGEVTFQHVDYLKSVLFSGITFKDEPKEFPCIINNDSLVYDGSRYRWMWFGGSQFTGFKDTALYVKCDYNRADYIGEAQNNYNHHGGQWNPFYKMPYVDFSEDFHLYFEPFYMERLQDRIFDFKSNTAMTRTPHIHFTVSNDGDPVNAQVTFNFENLVNLIEVNMEDFNPYCQSYVDSNYVNCKGCENLVYFRVGSDTSPVYRPSYDLEKCAKLDIPTLEGTLSHITRIRRDGVWSSKAGTLTIQKSIWEQLSETTTNKCIDTFYTINIIE